eukprot:Skav215265  [mRNA]  locus=scaffold2881:51787:60522:+ [translate_table: standard]
MSSYSAAVSSTATAVTRDVAEEATEKILRQVVAPAPVAMSSYSAAVSSTATAVTRDVAEEATEKILRQVGRTVVPVVPSVSPEVPPGRPDRPPSRKDRAQAIVVAKAQEPQVQVAAVPAVPDGKAMYTKEERNCRASGSESANRYGQTFAIHKADGQDLEIATQTARSKAAGEEGWKSDFQEAALNVRDFFQDLRTSCDSHTVRPRSAGGKSRHREKGRQATGPLWLHLAAQAKNLADQFDLDQLLEVLKLFCSVRYEDYELYMRLLGEADQKKEKTNETCSRNEIDTGNDGRSWEISSSLELQLWSSEDLHGCAMAMLTAERCKATTQQLCQLARLLARRRLRERNYASRLLRWSKVDMVVAHLLHKVRVSEEGLTELDEEMCCMVSPVFLVNYMSDALRRSFLKRCAEIQAGASAECKKYSFGGEWPLRNLACMELALRKELRVASCRRPPQVVVAAGRRLINGA